MAPVAYGMLALIAGVMVIALAMLAALGGALLVGVLYLMVIPSGWWNLTDPSTAWVAVAAFSWLIVLSIWKRMRVAR